MEVFILGSGSASDPTLPNSSVIVTAGETRIMIDCGTSVAREVIAAFRDPDTVDALVFTHHHPDHCYGFVSTVIAWSDGGRRKPLVIATTDWGRAQLGELQRLGLGRAWTPRFDYVWHRVPDALALGPARLSFAPTEHTVPNVAIRIESDGAALAYSGDGRPTPQARALYRDADLLMHECYTVNREATDVGHSWFDICAGLQRDLAPPRMLLYHIREDQRAAVASAAAPIDGLEVAATGALYAVPAAAAAPPPLRALPD